MNWNWFATNLAASALLPPVNLLLLGAFGLWWLGRRPRLGRKVLVLAFLGFWLFCTPYVAGRMLAALEVPYAPVKGDEAEAIVVLGGGLCSGSVEFGEPYSLNNRTLERVRYGAWLHRKTGKPLLVTGGGPDGRATEGPLMRAALEREFGVPVDWVEDRSANTRENARFSAPLLKASGVRRIYLVSHAWHLPRAIPEFEREGLVVVPAGTGFQPAGDPELFDFLPNASALMSSYYACHEWIGWAWYRIRN